MHADCGTMGGWEGAADATGNCAAAAADQSSRRVETHKTF